MRRLLVILIFALLSAIAWGQTYQNSGTCASGGSSCTITLTATAGWTIVAGASSSSGGSVTTSVTDSDSATYSACAGSGTAGSITGPKYNSTLGGEVFTAIVGGSGSHSVTFTIHASSSAQYQGGAVALYSGGFTTCDQMAAGTGTSSSLTSGNSGTTTSATELLVGFFTSTTNPGTGTATNSFTLRASGTSSNYNYIEDKNVSSTGAYPATITATNSIVYVGLLVTLKSAAGTAVAPTCSTNCAGTYNNSVTATFANPNSGTTIMCYTTDGSTPTSNGSGSSCTHGTSMGTGATGTVSVSAAETVKVVAGVSGDSDSTILSEIYALTVANPSPVYNAGATTSFSTVTSGASMYYNNTGGTPACPSTGTLYTGAISPSGTNSIQIIGCLSGYTASSVVTVAPDIAVATENLSGFYNNNWALPSAANTGISESGTTVTVTSTINPGCAGTCVLLISGSSVSGYNGVWQPTSATSTQWQFTAPSGLSTCSSGCGISQLTFNTNGSNQLPLDVNWTNGSWKENYLQLSPSGILVVAPDPMNSGSFEALANATTGSFICVTNGCQSIRTKEAYYQNHSTVAYIHPQSGSAIVGTACVSGTSCVWLQVTSTTATLYYANSSSTTNEGSATGLTVTDGSFIELRAESGCIFRPLINGSQIAGMSATYTISSCSTSGQPMIGATSGSASFPAQGGAVYNLSFYNIGGSSSGGYTPPTPSSYTTYTDSMNTSGYTMSLPWYPYQYWGGTFIPESSPLGGYAVGGSINQAISDFYLQTFGINQWEAFTVNVYPWQGISSGNKLGWWLGQLLDQPWTVGLNDGGCAGEGTLATCFDQVSYYLGITNGSISGGYSCAGNKDEYCGSPFIHGTKVTPTASPGNDVVTFAASVFTALPGDLIENRYLNGFVETWCKQGSSPATWQALHTYAANAWIKDANGNVQFTKAGLTSGATVPSSWGSTWNLATYTGASTSDGTGTWEYFGAICPTTTKYTRAIHVQDGDLGNPASTYGGYPPSSGGLAQALGIGKPAIGADAYLLPVYSNFSDGTVGYGSGEPCATSGQCQESGSVVSSGVF